MTNDQPLKPLTHGNILIVGAKSGNFDQGIVDHPRVVIWDSQNQHWTNKELPINTRAIFITRFIGHSDFGKILAEARKKQITIFNPEGTGMITKQVKELLDMSKPTVVQVTGETSAVRPTGKGSLGTYNKLSTFLPHIDWTKSNIENAKVLIERSKELGVTTTLNSLANYVGTQRRGGRKTAVVKSIQPKLDVAVEILDEAVRGLQDMRAFLVSTVEENRLLKLKVEKLKKAIED